MHILSDYMQNEISRFYEYIASVERYSDNTKQSYQNDIDGFAFFILKTYEISEISHISHFHIRSWIVSLMDAKSSTRTVHRKISSLSTFFKYLRKMEGLKADPMKKIVRPKSQKRLPIVIPEGDLSKNLSLNPVKEDDYIEVMSFLMMNLLYSAGLRRSELIGLEENDIDRDRMLIKVIGKGKKERFVPISHDIVNMIDNFRRVKLLTFKHQDFNLLFLTVHGKPVYPKLVYNIVNGQLKSIPNLERKSPHILRHSFATHLSDAGADINAIKMLLGHSSLAATQVYMHNAPHRLKAVYNKSHPRADKS